MDSDVEWQDGRGRSKKIILDSTDNLRRRSIHRKRSHLITKYLEAKRA